MKGNASSFFYRKIWGNLLPLTFILPTDSADLQQYAKTHPKQLWIVKPTNLQGGQGIRVVDNIANIKRKEAAIVQKYISNPYLIKGHKFDLRLYVLITSLDPLKVYIYGDGLVRFATKPYDTSPDKLGDSFIHLTNYEINKVTFKLL